jgi:hypothetical protein
MQLHPWKHQEAGQRGVRLGSGVRGMHHTSACFVAAAAVLCVGCQAVCFC